MKNNIQTYLGQPINRSSNLSKGLVAAWMLNEGGGTHAVDSSRINGLDGVVTSAVYQQSAKGNCANFNGTSSYIDMGTAASYPNLNLPTTLSIVLSMNSTTVAIGTRSIVSDYNVGSTASQYHLEMNRVAGKLAFRQGNTEMAVSTNTLSANTWYRIGVTRAGTTGAWTVKFYINGVLDSSTAGTANPLSQQGMSIGRIGVRNLFFFSGLINKVYMYNRVLNETEMMQDFANPLDMFILKKNRLANA